MKEKNQAITTTQSIRGRFISQFRDRSQCKQIPLTAIYMPVLENA